MDDDCDREHACTGYSLVRTGQEADLADDPRLWRSVWVASRDELLEWWVARDPGSRPEAWWRFDSRGVARLAGEAEVDCLSRHLLIGDNELRAIAARASQLAAYNRGRDPARRDSNYLEPGALERFAARVGLLDAEEMEVLHLS
jgi:hypothetical protein